MGMTSTESWGSQQWRLLRRALREGTPIEDAALLCGMSLIEARLLAKRDAERAPLPEEAFALLYDPDAPRAASSTQSKEAEMADDTEDGEIKRPDAAKAFEIYDKQIKPRVAEMDTIKGDLSQPWDDIKQHANFPKKVMNFIIGLENMEEAKRDHTLLALADGLKHRKLFLPRDLVTMAQGEAGDNVIPMGTREDDGLLVDEDDDEDGEQAASEASDPIPFTEASEAEVAKQEGRGRKRKADPAPGTGAAAAKAMSKAAAETAAMLN